MTEKVPALVIGAGPAGLMAAEALGAAGHRVVIAEAMPSPARKFLMAGKSGLNLTRAEPAEVFAARLDGGAAPEPPGYFRTEDGTGARTPQRRSSVRGEASPVTAIGVPACSARIV